MIIVVFLFLLLRFEGVLVWIDTSTHPEMEFFVAMVVALGVIALAIRESELHPPPHR